MWSLGWEPFLEDAVTIDEVNYILKVQAQHWDKHLENERLKFRISAAAVSTLSSAVYPSSIEVAITFLSYCPYLKLQLINDYNII